jgi:hypothetical protein
MGKDLKRDGLARFEVFTALILRILFWNVTLCSVTFQKNRFQNGSGFYG